MMSTFLISALEMFLGGKKTGIIQHGPPRTSFVHPKEMKKNQRYQVAIAIRSSYSLVQQHFTSPCDGGSLFSPLIEKLWM